MNKTHTPPRMSVRILALFLSVLLVFTLSPAYLAQADEETASIQETTQEQQEQSSEQPSSDVSDSSKQENSAEATKNGEKGPSESMGSANNANSADASSNEQANAPRLSLPKALNSLKPLDAGNETSLKADTTKDDGVTVTNMPAKDTKNDYNAQRYNEVVESFSWSYTGLPQFATGEKAEPTHGGAGTVDDPYLIYTAGELKWALVNNKSVKLMSDLDLGGRTGQNWRGDEINLTAAGVFDGNGHSIYNLYSNSGSGGKRNALIGAMDNAEYVLKNLHLSNCYLYAKPSWWGQSASVVGCFAGGNVQDCTVENVIIGNSDGSANHVGGLFNGVEQDTPLKSAHVKNVFARNINCYGQECVSGFIEGRWSGNCTPGGDITIENCALVDSVVISRGGHSGGFVSCDQATGTNTYRNCYTNVDVYGTRQTGVFIGVTHQNGHVFENCYAAGKIEGVNTIGGFYGCSDSQGYGTTITFKNCYTTSMVGMSNGGTYLGGFAAVGSSATFENCYAAGEVGTLKTNDDGGAPSGQGPFAGFDCGNGTYKNCYYDAQTTAMRNNGAKSGITAVSTKDLINLNFNTTGNTDAWTVNTDGYLKGNSAYPQLKVFADQGSAQDKAYSEASASTVLLEAKDFAAGDYDTVRHIRTTFPLTNNSNTTNGFDHQWSFYVGKDPNHPQYINESPVVAGTVPIITLSGQDTNPRTDRVTSVAPGIGWLQVQASANDQTGYRRLRLVPTSSIILASWNSLLQNNSDTKYVQDQNPPEGYDALSDAYTKYDHRDNISFMVMDSTNLDVFTSRFDWDTVENKKQELGGETDAYKEWLQSYIDQIKAQSGAQMETVTFPKDTPGAISSDASTLDYTVHQGSVTGKIKVSIEKLGEDGQYHTATWTDSLRTFAEGSGTANPTDEGTYRLSYLWTDDSGETLKADGSKNLYIVPPGEVHYKNNYFENDTSDYKVDPGAYLMGATVKAGSIPANDIKTSRDNYSFEGFSTRSDKLKDNEHDYTFNEQTKLFVNPSNPVTNVYAIWSLTDFTPAIEKSATNETVEKEGATRHYHKNGDIVKYTIKTSTTPTQADRTNYTWFDPIITDKLPSGLTLIADNDHPITFNVKSAEGNEATTKTITSLGGFGDSVTYDASSRTITATSGDLRYGGTGELTFYVQLNGTVPSDADPDVLGNSAKVEGTDAEKNAKNAQTPVVKPTPEPENSPVPGIKKASENDAKDPLRANFTVDVWNDGKDYTQWEGVSVSDTLPNGMDLIDDTVKLYKVSGSSRTEVPLTESDAALAQDYPPTSYSYGKTSDRTLFVKVGDIAGGEHYQVAYSVKVVESASKDALSNTATASGTGGPNDETMEDSSTATLGDPVVYADKHGVVETEDDDLFIGDEITYRIRIQNYLLGSVWRNIKIADILPDGLDLVPGSMKLYGPYNITTQDFTNDDAASAEQKAQANMVDPAENTKVTQVPDSAYNASSKKISYRIGDGTIRGGEGYTFEFKVQITPDVEQRTDAPYPPNWAYVGPENNEGDPGTNPGWIGPSWGPAEGGAGTSGGFVSGDGDPASPTGGSSNPGWMPDGGINNWGQNPDGSGGGFPEGYTPANVKWRTSDANITKTAVNTSRGKGANPHVGDKISYTVKVAPSKKNTRLENQTISDQIPEGLDLDTDSLYLFTPEGVKTKLDASVYNAESRTLSVPVGDIINWQTTAQVAVLTYSCTINDQANSQNTGNVAWVNENNRITTYPNNEKPTDVLPREDLPVVEKNVVNETRNDGTTQVRDVLSYDIKVTNPSKTRSWKNAMLFDYIPEGIDLDEDSFELEKPDGNRTKVDKSIFDKESRMVTMNIGTLKPGETYTLYYKSRVTEAVPEENPELITNSAWITADKLADKPNSQASVPAPTKKTVTTTTNSETSHSPQSGDQIGMLAVALIVVLGASAAVVGIVALKRRQDKKYMGAHGRR